MSDSISSNFIISKEDIISERLNVILQNFAANDTQIYGNFDEIPGIWKCLWYNDSAISGYKKGDFFWLNTESKEDFLKNNAKEIKDIADANPAITEKLSTWRSNDEEIFKQYNNVLTGYIDKSKSSPMPAYAELGELSACVQLVVSQKNNNKDKITNKSSWKKFLIDENDMEQILLSSLNAISSTISEHEYNYHFGLERLNTDFNGNLEAAKQSLTSYINRDFSNILSIYSDNYLKSDLSCNGFDTIKYFIRKPYPDRAISGYTVEYQWFRQWQSGFLEHGGLFKTTNYLTDSGKISIDFNWPISGESSRLFDVRYLATTSGKDARFIEIDESGENPPGDNILSVLYELDPEYFRSQNIPETAPVFYADNYDLNLTPIYKTVGLSGVAEVDAYENLGNYSPTRNIVNTAISRASYNNTGFSLDYDSVNSPEYYTYYAAGFCTE